nr:hypothetical protein [Ensifer aridi]
MPRLTRRPVSVVAPRPHRIASTHRRCRFTDLLPFNFAKASPV